MARGLSMGAVLGLKDKGFTSGLSKAAGQTSTFDRRLKHSTNSVRNFQSAVSRGIGDAVKKLAGLAIGAFTVRAIAGEVMNWTKAANQQIAAETKLETIMSRTKGVTKEQISGLKAYASDLQKAGVIGDEVAIAGMAQLAAHRLQATSVKQLSAGMMDLAVKQFGANVSTEQLNTVADAMGKAMRGNTATLRKYGIVLSAAEENQMKYGNEAQRSAILAQALERQVGGMNAAVANTPEWAMIRFKNALGDVREELGMRLLPSVTKGITWASSQIPSMASAALKGVDLLAGGFTRLHAIGAEPLRKNFTWLKGVGAGLWAGLKGQIEANRVPLQTIGSAVKDIGAGMGWVWKNIAQPFLGWLGKTGIPWAFGVLIRYVGVAAAAVTGIKSAFLAVRNAVVSVREGVGSAFAWMGEKAKGFANGFIGANNAVVRGLNNIQIKVPNWVPIFGGKEWGFNLKETPMLARGTPWWRGGQAIVGERGPELVNLPRGAEVVPNSRLRGVGSPVNFTVNIYADNMSAEEIVAKVVPLFRLAVTNAG